MKKELLFGIAIGAIGMALYSEWRYRTWQKEQKMLGGQPESSVTGEGCVGQCVYRTDDDGVRKLMCRGTGDLWMPCFRATPKVKMSGATGAPCCS